MAAYLRDEEGLGNSGVLSRGCAFGLVCLLFSPASERRGLGSVFFPPTRPRRRRHF